MDTPIEPFSTRAGIRKSRPLDTARALELRGIDRRVEQVLEESKPLQKHVDRKWHDLRRTLTDLYLGSFADVKVDGAQNCLYISPQEDRARIETELKHARQMARRRTKAALPTIEIRTLPPREQWDTYFKEHGQGLLYLPKPYIVPGARYQEMYNWDTAFVVRALLQSKKFDAAKDLVDNLLYEQKFYGTLLNGNRTYYLSADKSRSQPPLITSKIINIYDNWDKLGRAKKQEESDVAWLANAAKLSADYYQHWVTAPHLHASGLSRYASNRTTESDEVRFCEPGHYEGAEQGLKKMLAQYQKQAGEEVVSQGFTSRAAFKDMLSELYRKQPKDHDGKPPYQVRKDFYYIEQFLTPAKEGALTLSPEFYQGDFAMRESGFDPSRRFGFYNADIQSHLPVCLNAFRLRMEEGMAGIYDRLYAREPGNAKWSEQRQIWSMRADITKQAICTELWDDGVENGTQQRAPCFRDRNINKELCGKYDIPEFREYNFATALFPLWVGAATREQAEKTIAHILPALNTPYGLNTSDRQTGSQWDKPLVWAPLQVIAVEALEKYDHYRDALELAENYLRTQTRIYNATGKCYEKCESETGTHETAKYITMGYDSNSDGFAWTNAAIVEMRGAVKRLKQKIHHERLTGDNIDRPVRSQGIARPDVQDVDNVSVCTQDSLHVHMKPQGNEAGAIADKILKERSHSLDSTLPSL